MVYAFFFVAVSIIFRIIFSYRQYGRENLIPYKKNGRRYVIVANHLSMLDPIFIAMAYGVGRKLTIMGKAELFRHPLTNWLFTQVGVFPVERGSADTSALNKAIEGIENGRGMLIFPEGTRGTGDEMLKLKTGAFMIAAQTGADIIPVRLIYPTSTRKLKFFAPVVVKIGKPILAEELNLVEGGKKALRQSKITVKQRLDDLLSEYNESVGYVPPVKEELPQETESKAVETDENN
ncbi:MAG: 1-acyl-sn-glycerol-3-phosphate acyltransferase [Oscillospiraceae bacterium]|nr:1-acyl-sn-glycerol-3-phosphate acyltransferase [Oscillospiraceae bacterium]